MSSVAATLIKGELGRLFVGRHQGPLADPTGGTPGPGRNRWPLRLSPSHTKCRGDIAELPVVPILLSDPWLEVFVAACDDGHGSNLVVRSMRTGRWY